MSTTTAAPAEQQPRRLTRWLSLRRLPVPSLLIVGSIGLLIMIVMLVFGERIAGFSPGQQNLAARLQPPGTDGHIFGTDRLGRDVFARTVAGFRWSLPVGFVATIVASVTGTVIGLAAGWRAGWVRTVLTRFIDLAIAFPYLVLAVAIIAVTGRGFWSLTLILGFVSWMSFARVVFAETMKIKEQEYIIAARLMGMSSFRMLSTYVIRGLRPKLVVMFAFVFADLLVAEAAISFLGIGAPVGTASWGNQLAVGRDALFTAPWLMWAPAGAVILAVLTANLIGDGLNQHWNLGLEQE